MKTPARKITLYPNRRLYDPKSSAYIAYQDVFNLVQQGFRFDIVDRSTGLDRTQHVLVEVMLTRELEAAADAPPMLTQDFLSELIRLSAREYAPLVAEFLNHTLRSLSSAQSATDRESPPRESADEPAIP